MTRVLGIDPGLHITGYGIVEVDDRNPAAALTGDAKLVEAGIFKFTPKLALEQRLGQLHDDLASLIDETRPHVVAVEKLFAHYKHPRTAIIMAHGRGVILLVAQRAGLPIVHLPATEVKKAVTGNGHATKEQMQRSVMAQCRLAQMPNPPDVADAIAIALTHARRIVLDRL